MDLSLWNQKDLKTWLTSNNTKFYYALQDPETQEKQLPKINAPIGASVIEVDTSILPSNVEFTVIEKIKQI